jgi:dTDP-4-dehydrorhamnose reductase
LIGQGRGYLAERAGLYHLSSTGFSTWHGFAQAIVGSAGKPRVTPIATAEYPTPARRPAYGVLATTRFERVFGFSLPGWQEALAACQDEEHGPGRLTEP